MSKYTSAHIFTCCMHNDRQKRVKSEKVRAEVRLEAEPLLRGLDAAWFDVPTDNGGTANKNGAKEDVNVDDDDDVDSNIDMMSDVFSQDDTGGNGENTSDEAEGDVDARAGGRDKLHQVSVQESDSSAGGAEKNGLLQSKEKLGAKAAHEHDGDGGLGRADSGRPKRGAAKRGYEEHGGEQQEGNGAKKTRVDAKSEGNTWNKAHVRSKSEDHGVMQGEVHGDDVPAGKGGAAKSHEEDGPKKEAKRKAASAGHVGVDAKRDAEVRSPAQEPPPQKANPRQRKSQTKTKKH
jgi:hypothetical protein